MSTKDLAVPAGTKTFNAVVKYDVTEAAITALEEEYGKIETIENKADYALVVAGINACLEPRVAIAKKIVELKRDFKKWTKTNIVDPGEAFITRLEAVEKPLKVLRYAEDDRLKKIRDDKKKVDDERKTAIEAKIAALTPNAKPSWTVKEYDVAIKDLIGRHVFEPEYQEFLGSAILAHEKAMTTLKEGREDRVLFEAQQATLRAAQERIEAEKEARDKIENRLYVWMTPKNTIEELVSMAEDLKLQEVTEDIYGPLKKQAKTTKASSLKALSAALETKRAQKKLDDEKKAHRIAVKAEENRRRDLAIKQEKNKKRQLTIQLNFDAITSELNALINYTSSGVIGAIETLEGWAINEDVFHDRFAEAVKLKASTLAQMKKVLTRKQAVEAEEKLLQKERAELLATQKAEKDRKAKEEAEQVKTNEKAADDLRKANAAKEEADRVERLRPDKEKLWDFAKEIEALVLRSPEVEELEALEIKAEAMSMLLETQEYIESKTNPA